MKPELNDREVRTFTLDEKSFEKRDDGTRRIVGHAAVFNQWSEDLGGFREQIAPGAFAEAITADDVRALFNHDTNQVLGRSVSKTLTLLEDQRGLLSEIILPDTQLARDLEVLMTRGDINQMSFAFSIDKNGQEWKKIDDGSWERTIIKISRLYDVSVVTFAAYPQTDAAVRALQEVKAAAEHPAGGLTTQTAGVVLKQTTRLRMIQAGL